MFIDLHLISEIPEVSNLSAMVNIHIPQNLYFISILLSQLISNVPAAILLSKFSNNWLVISYGVNIGGNGLVVDSLANIIALLMVKDRRIWVEFHKYSLIFLAITSIVGYIQLF